MGLFRKEQKQAAVDPSLVAAAREYIARRLAQDPKEPVRRKVSYSLASPPYMGERITDLKRFMDDARRDTAMFDSPALKHTYHEWEKKKAERKTFSSEVLRRLKEMNMRPSEFYKAANLDKRVFHSLKSDYLYTPSKSTALRCCFGLRLSIEEAVNLLKLAGYSLSPSNSRELAVRFCLENELYDIQSVNYLLTSLGEPPLE